MVAIHFNDELTILNQLMSKSGVCFLHSHYLKQATKELVPVQNKLSTTVNN